MNTPAPVMFLGTYYQGNTIKSLTFSITDHPIEAACIQIRTATGGLVYEYANTLNTGSLVLEELPPSVTKDFPVGVLNIYINVKVDATHITLAVINIEMKTNFGGCP